MDAAPRTPMTTRGPRVARSAGATVLTPRHSGQTPLTARPTAAAHKANHPRTTHTPQNAPRSDVFQRLTAGVPTSTARRHTAPRASLKRSPDASAPARRATAPTIATTAAVAPSGVKAAHKTPHTARPRAPLYATPLPATFYRGVHDPSASPKAMATAGHTSRAAPRKKQGEMLTPRRNEPLVTSRGASPDPREPSTAAEESTEPTSPDPTKTHKNRTPATTVTVHEPAVELSAAAERGAEHHTLPPSANRSSESQVRVVRKAPPLPPVSPKPGRGADAGEGATEVPRRSTAARSPTASPPPNAVPYHPPRPAAADERVSLRHGTPRRTVSPGSRSQSYNFVCADSRSASRPGATSAALPPRSPQSAAASAQARRLYQFLDSDSDGVVSVDDLFTFVFLHADACLSTKIDHLEALLDCTLTDGTTDARSQCGVVDADTSIVSVETLENVVSTLLLLATHIDNGGVLRADWVETCLQSFLRSGHHSPLPPASAATTTSGGVSVRRSRRPSFADRERRRSRAVSVLSTLTMTDHTSCVARDVETDGRVMSPRSESHESALTLSVGSAEEESVRALLRSIQFREVTPVPAFLTVAALEKLVQAGLTLTTPASTQYWQRRRLVSEVQGRLAATTDSQPTLARLRECLAGPLAVHAFVMQLELLEASHFLVGAQRRPHATPLRALMWRSSPLATGVGSAAHRASRVCSQVATTACDVVLAAACALCPRGAVGQPRAQLPPLTLKVTTPATPEDDQNVRRVVRVSASRALPRSMAAVTAAVHPSDAESLMWAMPYCCVFRSLCDEARLAYWAQQETKRQTIGGVGGGVALATGSSRGGALVLAAVLVCVRGVVCPLIGYHEVCLLLVMALVICLLVWHTRQWWRRVWQCTWLIPAYAIRTTEGAATVWHAQRARQRLALIIACGASWPSPMLRLRLCQQSEWWVLQMLPVFFAPSNDVVSVGDESNGDRRVAHDTADEAVCIQLRHVPASLYVTLAAIYAMAAATDTHTAAPCTTLCPINFLWQCLNSLVAVPSLTEAPHTLTSARVRKTSSTSTPPAALHDVDVLAHPLCQALAAHGVNAVRTALNQEADLSEEPQQRAFVEHVVRLLVPCAADGWEGRQSEETQALCDTANLALSADAWSSESVDVRPFAYHRLWRRDERECAAVFASVIFLLSPPPDTQHGSAGELRPATHTRLLIAAALLSTVNRNDAPSLTTAHKPNWYPVQRAILGLLSLRHALIDCLSREEPLSAKALISPRSILARCIVQNHPPPA